MYDLLAETVVEYYRRLGVGAAVAVANLTVGVVAPAVEHVVLIDAACEAVAEADQLNIVLDILAERVGVLAGAIAELSLGVVAAGVEVSCVKQRGEAAEGVNAVAGKSNSCGSSQSDVISAELTAGVVAPCVNRAVPHYCDGVVAVCRNGGNGQGVILLVLYFDDYRRINYPAVGFYAKHLGGVAAPAVESAVACQSIAVVGTCRDISDAAGYNAVNFLRVFNGLVVAAESACSVAAPAINVAVDESQREFVLELYLVDISAGKILINVGVETALPRVFIPRR